MWISILKYCYTDKYEFIPKSAWRTITEGSLEIF